MFLKCEGVKDIEISGPSRIRATCETAEQANKLIENDIFKLYKYEAFIPAEKAETKAIIHIDKVFTIEKITHAGKGLNDEKIIRARRFTKKILKEDNSEEIIELNTVLLYFNTDKAPTHITINGLRIRTEQYIEPVVQCRNCLAYGHYKAQCRSTTKCLKCGSTDHILETCNAEKPTCTNCKGEHNTNDKN
ncbi:unnamed protein product [Brassicogethes aeneus]|uniref:CCHC-type domain-containing protein n=1 Tax=Brassicogethes aeneus TaxID=1431903 RepID=A0A9P0B4J8_BRAAE|nr:unnamed protein product [Brassicogethes aeneus]